MLARVIEKVQELKTHIYILRRGLNEFEYGLFCRNDKFESVELADLTEEKAFDLAERLGIEIDIIPF